MSQSVPETSTPKNTPAPEQKKQPPPITDASPDDPIEIVSPGTGKTSS